jgi:hypothetical protein
VGWWCRDRGGGGDGSWMVWVMESEPYGSGEAVLVPRDQAGSHRKFTRICYSDQDLANVVLTPL